MSAAEDDFSAIIGDIFQKCGNDAEKFLTHVANTLKTRSNFFDNAEHKLQILGKCFDFAASITVTEAAVSTTKSDEHQPDNDAIVQNQSITVNELSINDSIKHDIVPATQYNPDESSRDSSASDNLVINETTESRILNDDSLQGTGVEDLDDDDDEIIPETQYVPDQVSIDGDSRPISRVSSRNSLGHDANEKHVSLAINAETFGKSSLDESNCDEGDELIHINQETNSSWPPIGERIEASQAVIGHLDTELLGGIGPNAVGKDLLTDSINLSSSVIGNASKIDAEVPNQSLALLKGHGNYEQDANTTATSFSSCREAERSTSVTPELDVFMTPMRATLPTATPRTTFNARSSTPDSSVSKAFEEKSAATTLVEDDDGSVTPDIFNDHASQANRLPFAPSIVDDDRSMTPDLFTQANNAPTVSSAIDTSVVDMNDDSYSNDNELFGACTQVFPPPPPRSFHNRQALNISATEVSDAVDSDRPAETKSTNDAAAEAVADVDKNSSRNDPQPNDKNVDEVEDSDDFYAAQTQVNPFTVVAPTIPVTEATVPSLGHSSKENSQNKLNNSGMGPPMLPKKSRNSSEKLVSKKSAGDRLEDDLFAAATQEFPPLKAAVRSTNDIASPAAGANESIFDMETQPLLSPNDSASKKREAIPDDDSQPPSTPRMTAAAQVSVKDIENAERFLSKKPKAMLSRKWLFESESEKSPSPPQKKSKKSNEKRKSFPVETLTSKSAKKVKDTEQTANHSVSEAEIARIKKRRVSVVLERLQFDVNSNVSPAHTDVGKFSNSPIRQKSSSKDNVNSLNQKDGKSSSQVKSRETEKRSKPNNSDRTMSDVTQNRATTRARAKVTFDIPESKRNGSKTRSSMENAGVLVAASSSDLPLIQVTAQGSKRAKTRNAVESSSNAGTVAFTHRIMFTKVDMHGADIKPAIKNIQKMGGEVVDSPAQCTALVSEKVWRTHKFMSSLGRGVPIVIPEWLIASHKQKRFVDTEPYLLKDAENEKRHNFNLKLSLEIARRQPLYKGYVVFITPNIVPPPNEIITIVECGGGTCTDNFQQRFSSKLKKFVISSPNDKLKWKEIRALYPGIPIASTEGLMRNVMQQKIDFDGFTLCK